MVKRVKSLGSRVKSRIMLSAALALIAMWSGQLRAQGSCYIDPFTGQKICVPAGGLVQPQFPTLDSRPVATDSSAPCRISVGDGSAGSGTLVARSPTGGLVLTCSHLFDRSTANVTVTFANGQRFVAKLVERDRAHDLATLVIHRPDVEPVEVDRDDTFLQASNGLLTACGYGPNGQLRCIRGDITGQATPVGAVYPSLTMRGAVRPGDSGGGVLNAQGRLVGVIWGQRDGMTFASCGRPLREMLDRILGTKPAAGNGDAIGIATPPTPNSAGEPTVDWQAWSQDIDARIRALDAAKQEKGDYLQRGDVPDLSAYAKRDELAGGLQGVSGRFDSVLERVQSARERIEEVAENKVGFFQGLSMGKLLVGALGISGPLGAAVVVAGGLAGRRIKRRVSASQPAKDVVRPIAVDSPPPPQRTVAETHFVSYETDSYSKAHHWASEQIARKYPGATEILQAQDSLIKQHLASR